MTNPEEYSESGNPIIRYDEQPEVDESLEGNDENLVAISDHIEKYVGEIHMVFHELVSPVVHVDLHWVAPSDRHPFHTIVTSGMSDRPMAAPEGYDNLAHAELCVCLPPEWEISQEAFEDERWYWPFRLLKMLARFPHEYSTWLGFGHTLPNGDPPEPYAENTKFTGVMLGPPVALEACGDFMELSLRDDKCINFYGLIPLYEEETALKLKKGADEIFDRFDKREIDGVLDVSRPNVAKGGLSNLKERFRRRR